MAYTWGAESSDPKTIRARIESLRIAMGKTRRLAEKRRYASEIERLMAKLRKLESPE